MTRRLLLLPRKVDAATAYWLAKCWLAEWPEVPVGIEWNNDYNSLALIDVTHKSSWLTAMSADGEGRFQRLAVVLGRCG